MSVTQFLDILKNTLCDAFYESLFNIEVEECTSSSKYESYLFYLHYNLMVFATVTLHVSCTNLL